MTKSIKVINCSISLNVKNNSEEYAAAVLRDWYKKAMVNQPKMEFTALLNDFHKDIYLSGLYVYLLSPRLCKGLCNTIGYDSVNINTLKHVFASCGFELEDQKTTQTQNNCNLEQYVKNIELLMKTELVGISSSMEQLANQTATICNQQRDIKSHMTEVSSLNIAEIINSLANLEKTVNTLSTTYSTVTPMSIPTELSAMPDTLKNIQSQINTLQLTINSIGVVENPATLNSHLLELVDDKLKKAKKIKSKKIW